MAMKRSLLRRSLARFGQDELGRPKEHSRVQSLTTVVLIDEKGAHEKSTAIFRLMPYMGLPYRLLSPMLLCIPSFLCNPIYDLVYRNLGTISKHWPFDHEIEKYRDRMLGLEGKTLEEASSQFGSS